MIQNVNDLSVDNEKWKYCLTTIDSRSQNQYTRSVERYLKFCDNELLTKESSEAVESFMKFCKDPSSRADIPIYKDCKILSFKEGLAAKTLWSVLSHLKKFFQVCASRQICDENPHLNGNLQQWEKLEEINQSKV
jgi:site-specific recombinase XerD